MILYTVKDVAKMLGYREVTIRKKIRDGDIKTTKIVGSNAVRVSDKEMERLTGENNGREKNVCENNN